MEAYPVLVAFILTLMAGLSTGIGSILAFFTRKTKTSFLSMSLGFSAGVMIYVSFMEIIQKAKMNLVGAYGEVNGTILTIVFFFAGILLIALIDKLVPSYENPHEIRNVEDISANPEATKKLYRMGLFSALIIAIHNFPEGLATFAAGLSEPSIAYPIAVAVAIHNIPEGIAVSIPLYYATGSRKKAFVLSFLSGLAEPAGALIGYFILYSFFSDTLFGAMFAMVAGIMVFISLDELLPTAQAYGKHHYSIYGLIAGMALMAVSLLLFL
ncbi:MAG: zinc transporter ZupT [Bacteroidetes bacterium]|nr:zinc transporter ZupT [Bacteroidota bacterium]